MRKRCYAKQDIFLLWEDINIFQNIKHKKYKAGTSFEEIVSLYKFDAELRELFFKYLLQIERQMRSLMSYYFTEMYGAEQKQYLDANNYNNTKEIMQQS